ncbi:MAG: hypothetical protein V7640_301 [Betaproteobacteria bacterium]
MPAIRSALQVRDTGFDGCAMIHLPRKVRVLLSGNVAQRVPLPLESDGVRVVWIAWFSNK